MFDVDITKIELHCFSDASQKAYETVAYLHILFNDERIRTVFVAPKTRVAPLKKLTLPRLELMDLASRGASVFELRDNPVWFQGPEWLALTSECWPRQNNTNLEGLDGSELEYRKTISNVIQFGCIVNSEKLLVLENYSSLRRLYRVTAWIKRFIKKVKKIVSAKGPLTTEELEMYWMQVEQRQCYSEEFQTLAGVGQVKNLEGMQKSCIVLFTCATTRALHLELAPTMTTESFLMAFRRFISRRGNCRIMYSDNAKTFKKSNRELEQISKILLHDKFPDFICNQKITWKFIVERGAWWGRFYERLVKSVKECLRKVLVRALLSFEELSTIITEVGSVWKVFDIVDGAPAVPSDVSGDVAYIWMLPSTTSFVILACLLARTCSRQLFRHGSRLNLQWIQ
ncbi:hypothetical protein AVEN_147955-1 [Araneus ventricosus]|uniref:Integrase catalytic domain-containing protein n=1 Tax=Araneus ventricosus TaxID=182803 RepID=A0A4Y2UER3_ARAVE|nr:hypothetical protein AVEN_147955-1 [Araneus ventricosus]